jgi:hypothetical protein
MLSKQKKVTINLELNKIIILNDDFNRKEYTQTPKEDEIAKKEYILEKMNGKNNKEFKREQLLIEHKKKKYRTKILEIVKLYEIIPKLAASNACKNNILISIKHQPIVNSLMLPVPKKNMKNKLLHFFKSIF